MDRLGCVTEGFETIFSFIQRCRGPIASIVDGTDGNCVGFRLRLPQYVGWRRGFFHRKRRPLGQLVVVAVVRVRRFGSDDIADWQNSSGEENEAKDVSLSRESDGGRRCEQHRTRSGATASARRVQ